MREEGRAFLNLFHNPGMGRTSIQARALHGFARGPYAVRRWAFRERLRDFVLLHDSSRAWELAEIQRRRRDQVTWPCYATPLLLTAFDWLPDRLTWCSALVLDLEADSEKIWNWMKYSWAAGMPPNLYTLDRLRTRLPARAREIEERYIWPLLVSGQPGYRAPDFWRYTTPEGRAKRLFFITRSLVREEDEAQAMLLEDEVGRETLREITLARLERFEHRRPPPLQLQAVLEPVPLTLKQQARGRSLPVELPSADALNRLEPELAERTVRLLLSRLGREGSDLQHLTTRLDAPRRAAVAPMVEEAWLQADELQRVTALAASLPGVLEYWEPDTLLRSVTLLQRSLRGLDAQERPAYPPGRARLAGVLAACLSLLGERAPPAAWDELERALLKFDSELSSHHPVLLADELLRGFRAAPGNHGAEGLVRPLFLRLLDQPLSRADGLQWFQEIAEQTCESLPSEARARWKPLVFAKLSNTGVSTNIATIASCLVALGPTPGELRDAQDAAVRVFESDADASTRNAALWAMQLLGEADPSEQRREELLNAAMRGLEDIPYPRCGDLAALARKDDIAAFARIISLPTCGTVERSGAVEALARAQGLQLEHWGQWDGPAWAPFFQADPVPVALWLDERAL